MVWRRGNAAVASSAAASPTKEGKAVREGRETQLCHRLQRSLFSSLEIGRRSL
ncbi:hypothetical protein [Nostoc sp.]|uniref:hypothetical protein n=1 Tax=Nostoc sp. TaxID=1180 RepID=UPI002FFAC1FD